MNQILIEITITSLAALLTAAILFPLLIKAAHRVGWVDKPNHRKIHCQPTPVVGGIGIVISAAMALLLTQSGIALLQQYPVLMGAAFVLLVTGVWDDRININPKYRLAIQLLCATALAASGIRLSSLYGILGIYELTGAWQYALTIIIVMGVTNAYNLIDGIDGLAGGIALINLSIMAFISYRLGAFSLVVLLVAMATAALVFLRFNFHPARIFMGDGGSLVLGFLMPAAGILLIEKSNALPQALPVQEVVAMVAALLALPVFDSLRVYIWRIRRGQSPFKADKTHLHHLILNAGITASKTTYLLYAAQVLFFVIGWTLMQLLSLSVAIMAVAAIFVVISHLLQLNGKVLTWSQKIRKMETLS